MEYSCAAITLRMKKFGFYLFGFMALGIALSGCSGVNRLIKSGNAEEIYAKGVDNIAITGKGVIDGQGRTLAYNMMDQIHQGILDDDLKYDRPSRRRPRGIYLRECDNVKIKGILIKNTCDWVQTYDQCSNIVLDSITVDSKAYWNNDGLDIVDCKDMKVLNCFIDATDDAICLKSHDHRQMCENVEIRNNVARSSASGIKFGTVSAGGYKNVKIINNSDHMSENFEQMVYRNIFTNKTIEELAAECNKSLTSFKKEFDKHFFEPPHRWFIKQRLMKSRLLLISTNNPIAEIGRECRFPNTSHFIKLFKREYDMTPAAYRNKHSESHIPVDETVL